MTATEINRFGGILQARQAELEALLRDREAIAVNSAADMLDQIQHASERDMAMRIFERESLTLMEVRAALDRIRLGTFGMCLECEEDISPKRLAALPWTSSCLTCREAADRRGLLSEGPSRGISQRQRLTSPAAQFASRL